MSRLLPPPGIPTVFSAPFVADPHATYDWLREFEPVYREPMSRMVFLTRHRDVVTALTHPGLSAAGGQEERSRVASVPKSMLNTDGPEHERLRRPANLLVGPAALRGLADDVAIGLEEMLRSRRGDTLDLVGDIARPAATMVMARLLGLGDAHLGELGRHCAAVEVALNPVPTPAQAAEGRAAAEELGVFLADAVAAAPAHSPLGRLADSADLSANEVRGILSLCIVGGWTPLAELVASTAQVVLASGDLRRALDDPRLAEDLTEELLRWHTPIPFVARRADRDVEISGETVPEGQMVLAVIAAANRDPALFDDPHMLRTGRPRQHIALGYGPHFCMGAGLIREVVPRLLPLLSAGLEPLADDGGVLGSGVRILPGVFPRTVASVEVTPTGVGAQVMS